MAIAAAHITRVNTAAPYSASLGFPPSPLGRISAMPVFRRILTNGL